MKLLQAVLFFGVRAGRPSSHGVLFSTDMSAVETQSESRSCYTAQAQIDGNWQTRCIEAKDCCSRRIVRSARKVGEVGYVFVCGCTASGKPHDGGPAHCCSGKADPDNPTLCGCIPPNVAPHVNQSDHRILPLDKSDCCHDAVPVEDKSAKVERARQFHGYNVEPFMKCGPRSCQKPGGKLGKNEICCGDVKANIPTKFDYNLCQCIPADTVVRPDLMLVESTMCCSGKYTSVEGEKRTCSCIPGGQEIPADLGAVKSDCCSKGFTKTPNICQNDECVAPHNKFDHKKGEICCTDRSFTGKEKASDALIKSTTKAKDGLSICGCIKGGTTISQDKEAWCCSKTIGADGKCTWINYPQEINPDIMTEDECFSGKASNDKCLCMKANADTRGAVSAGLEQNCCSGRLNVAKNRCGCTVSGALLEEGTSKEECCTGLVDPTNSKMCMCGHVGLPLAKKKMGMSPEADCCSAVGKKEFCGCISKDKNTTNPAFCCVPPVKGRGACGCLKGGEMVTAGNSAEDVCCTGDSEEIEDDRLKKCKIEVCTKKPLTYVQKMSKSASSIKLR